MREIILYGVQMKVPSRAGKGDYVISAGGRDFALSGSEERLLSYSLFEEGEQSFLETVSYLLMEDPSPSFGAEILDSFVRDHPCEKFSLIDFGDLVTITENGERLSIPLGGGRSFFLSHSDETVILSFIIKNPFTARQKTAEYIRLRHSSSLREPSAALKLCNLFFRVEGISEAGLERLKEVSRRLQLSRSFRILGIFLLILGGLAIYFIHRGDVLQGKVAIGTIISIIIMGGVVIPLLWNRSRRRELDNNLR